MDENTDAEVSQRSVSRLFAGVGGLLVEILNAEHFTRPPPSSGIKKASVKFEHCFPSVKSKLIKSQD
jgi:hypothetical protein